MARFEELKQYAFKQAYYQQGKSLQDCIDKNRITEDLLEHANRGICLSLSLRWLSDKLKHKPVKTFWRVPHHKRRNAKIFAAHAPIQQKLRTEQPGDAEREYGIRARTNFDVSQVVKYKELDILGILNEWFDLASKNRNLATLLGYKVKIEPKNREVIRAGHAVGLFQGNFRTHFFDPNVGAYMIKKDCFNRFFEAYLRILKDKKSWAISNPNFQEYEKVSWRKIAKNRAELKRDERLKIEAKKAMLRQI